MKRFSSLLAGFAAVVVLSGTAEAQTSETFEWSGLLPAGGTLEVRGVNGDIEAAPSASPRAEVRAVKTGKKSDPRAVQIEVVQDAIGVLVCAVYPSRGADRPNRCARNGYVANVRDNDVDVDFIVKVPAGAGLVARTVNGKVSATALSGDIEASTVNGGIDLSTAGVASANTVNGSIDARIGRSQWTGTREYRTVNGAIKIELPADARAAVKGRTVNGDLDSDFPLTIQTGRLWGPRSFEGTIGGGGGGRLEIETVNGAIRLRRAS